MLLNFTIVTLLLQAVAGFSSVFRVTRGDGTIQENVTAEIKDDKLIFSVKKQSVAYDLKNVSIDSYDDPQEHIKGEPFNIYMRITTGNGDDITKRNQEAVILSRNGRSKSKKSALEFIEAFRKAQEALAKWESKVSETFENDSMMPQSEVSETFENGGLVGIQDLPFYSEQSGTEQVSLTDLSVVGQPPQSMETDDQTFSVEENLNPIESEDQPPLPVEQPSNDLSEAPADPQPAVNGPAANNEGSYFSGCNIQ